MTFSGSYRPDDCIFLLKPVELAATPVGEKERLIQSGARHYSEMISVEKPPPEDYLQLFHQAHAQNRHRHAVDLARLAVTLAAASTDEIVLISLARAGTPIGVLLKRALRYLGKPTTHYSVSIIRDRGIDVAALQFILERHASTSCVFVDGWTGKGAIATELRQSVRSFNHEHETQLPEELTVVSDLAGVASLAATADDYLLPSSVLNAIISGLVSRTILNSDVVGPGDFHACLYYDNLAPHDLSQWWVEEMAPLVYAVLADASVQPISWPVEHRENLRRISEEFVARTLDRYGITDRNRVKPGIGEATRALLRRLPDRLLLQDSDGEDIQHLLYLATRSAVPVEVVPDLPYRAATLIKTLGVEQP